MLNTQRRQKGDWAEFLITKASGIIVKKMPQQPVTVFQQCYNSHGNQPAGVAFYCITKDRELRQTTSLKLDSGNTRICSIDWKEEKKLSRAR